MVKKIKKFYKENNLWYIDLPEFITGGYGTKSDLLMVDGSDKMLDILSRNKNEVVIEFSDGIEDNQKADATMTIAEPGMNQSILTEVGHAPIEYGRYYNTTASIDGKEYQMRAWLCPVAEWVFGTYPENIYVNVLKF